MGIMNATIEQSNSELIRIDVALCKDAPVEAMRFGASSIQFAAPKQETKNTKSREIELLARTPVPIEHWYWGSVIHDFSGMSSKETIVLDYCHDDEQLVGFANQFVVEDRGLVLKGRIESTSDDDAAETLLKRADKGIPYEASIYFAPLLLEYIPEGMVTQVNGKQVEGECLIVRKWNLRACSVCPHGYDYGTESKLSAADRQPFKLNWKGDLMSTTPANKTTEANADGSGKGDLIAQLTQFTDKFGPVDGVEYFKAGKSMAVALDEHVTKLTANHSTEVTKLKADHDAIVTRLTADVTKLTAERDEAIAKVNAAKLAVGEQTAIDTGTPGAKTKLATSMTEAREMAKKKS
jgi:hypothetical protein